MEETPTKAQELFKNCSVIYGTHKMTDGIKYGLEYGFIDTATGYNNASLIKKYIDETKKVPIIITKFNQNDFDTGIEKAVENHLSELHYAPDVVMMHTPLRTNEENVEAFQKLKKLFPNKIIGISNFDLPQTVHMVKNGCFPQVVEIEYHPHFQPRALTIYCQHRGIVILAYRPFAKGDLLTDDIIRLFANNQNVPVSHLLLEWLHQKEIIPIVSSNKLENIDSNKKFGSIKVDGDVFKQLDELDHGLLGSTCMVRFCKKGDKNPVV